LLVVVHSTSLELQDRATIGLLTIPERKISCFILSGRLGGNRHEDSDFIGRFSSNFWIADGDISPWANGAERLQTIDYTAGASCV